MYCDKISTPDVMWPGLLRLDFLYTETFIAGFFIAEPFTVLPELSFYTRDVGAP